MIVTQRTFRLAITMIFLLSIAAETVMAQDSSGSESGSPQTIEIGSSVAGELSAENPSEVYRFTGQAGDVIAISMNSTDVDPYLRLGDAQGNELLSDDDSAAGLNARIGPIMLPADGDYVLVASTFDYTVSGGSEVEMGTFTVRIDRFEPIPMDYPGDIEGDLSPETPLIVYSFEGQQGDVISISMDSDDLDSFLAVAPATEIEDAAKTDDDSGDDLDSLIIPYIVPETGTYFVTATSYDADPEGEFEVQIDRLESTPIRIGDTVEAELTSDARVLLYSFEGQAGQVINSVVESAAEFDTTMTVLGPDGSEVGFNDDADVRSTRAPAIMGLELPATGTYQIVIAPFVTGNTGSLSLTLSAGESEGSSEG